MAEEVSKSEMFLLTDLGSGKVLMKILIESPNYITPFESSISYSIAECSTTLLPPLVIIVQLVNFC
jgi:hypothetical protein